MLQQVSSLVVLAVIATAAPAPAMQIRGTIRGGQVAAPKTLALIANPYAAATADSALAVAVGTAARDRLERSVGGDYRIITRKEMNDALTTYGYGNDAVLTPLSAGQLARQLSARYFVTSTIAKSAGGYSITARLIGANLDVGQVSSVTGLTAPELAGKLADALAPAIRALADAKVCKELSVTKPAKALEAANKALRSVPNYGLAEFCLAEIALKAREQILERTRAIVRHNLGLLDAFFADFPDLFGWRKPEGSCVAFVRYKGADGVEQG